MKKALIVFTGILLICCSPEKKTSQFLFLSGADTSYVFIKPYAKFYKITHVDEHGQNRGDPRTVDALDVTLMINVTYDNYDN